MLKRRIDFMGLRKVFFGISIVLVLISLAAIAVRGLDFGIEFQGGTVSRHLPVAERADREGARGVR